MEKNSNILFLIFFLIININNINSYLYRKPIAHPIKIKYDKSNLLKNDNTKYLIKLLKDAKKIITKLVYCNNIRKININKNVMSKCNYSFNFVQTTRLTADLIIFPILNDKISRRYNFTVNICNLYGKLKIQPSVAILNINSRIKIEKIKEDKNYEYLILLEMLRALTDSLGLTKDFISEKMQPKNNFFQTPSYLLSNSNSFKSVKKLYELLQMPLPDIKVSNNGQFYISYWGRNSIIKDFRNEKISLDSDISEVSMNLLSDTNYYRVAECDFSYKFKNKCYRIDQKCLYPKDYASYYLNYGINMDKENEITCYLSNSINLINNQCGVRYGLLLNEVLDFTPLVKKFNKGEPFIRKYTIPESKYYDNQTLNLLVPSEKCPGKTPRTIYFKTGKRKINNNIKLENITFNEEQKKYFVSYLAENEVYFKEFLQIFKNNGLIRSYAQTVYHNLLLTPISENDIRKKIINSKDINKYQKIFHFIGNDYFHKKEKLYLNYLYMKSYFPKNYTFIPKTYIYPRDNTTIIKLFKNYTLNMSDLWIVKPINLISQKGTHVFKSLSEEKNKQFIISKYLSKPHLIDKKKYSLKLYVLVTGFRPLKIYLYKDGKVDIAERNYALNISYINKEFGHATNAEANKENINAKKSKKNKWNLKAYEKYLKSKKINSKVLFDKIEDVIIKTIISGQKKIVNITKELNLKDRNMFNLFSFDFFISRKHNPFLLGVNAWPLSEISDEMDGILKSNLLVDTLNIVGIVPFSHQKFFRAFDRDSYGNKIRDIVNNSYCELTRPRGDFKLIFPLKKNIKKYKRMFLKGTTRENKDFWNKILKDK